MKIELPQAVIVIALHLFLQNVFFVVLQWSALVKPAVDQGSVQTLPNPRPLPTLASNPAMAKLLLPLLMSMQMYVQKKMATKKLGARFWLRYIFTSFSLFATVV